MKKIYFLSVLTLMMIAFLPQWADAQSDTQRGTHVTASQALNVGYSFMRTGSGSTGGTRGGTQNNNVSKQAMQLVYTGQATDSLTGVTTDCYYVFTLQPKGFVIVAADDRVEPILGYSYDNNFMVANMPEHVRGWLGNYEKQIQEVTKSNLQPEPATRNKWTRLKNGQATSTRSGESVGPLLTTTWDQGQYYNALCPEDAEGLDGHALTGCVATAMAQIINYWGSPVHGRGTHSYECNYGTLTVNYGSASYDYANMPNALTAASTTEEVNAVATLMRDCGVATNMGYGPSESGSYDMDARAGMINFFLFSPDMSYAERAYFTNTEWEDMLRADIDANRPVMYSGHGTGGHTFICDGYQQDNYFHFNFGWSGFADGWYLTSSLTPGGSNFSSDQSAIFGIVPDSTGNVILGQMQGTSTFVVDEPLEFYHLMGHNAYTGNSYGNPCNNTVNFVSANNANQLVADIMEFEDQNITIYDGAGTWLRNLCGGCENDLSPIISTGNALNVTYSGNLYYTGFKLIISQNSNCRMVSNIISSVDTTTVHLAWVENGIATQWQVEYGFSGFSLGEGTLVTVSMEFVDINNLVKFTKYDFYIRSVCGDSQYGPWSNVIKVMTEASYWTDVVTSQPEGFVEDSLGNITISSAEGLAWYAHNTLGSNYYGGKHVTLTADIDLSQHMWKPMRLDNGSFNGNGHTIYNMFIIEHNVNYSNSVGFFGNVMNSTIENVILKNIYVSYSYTGNSGYCDVGGLAGFIETYYGHHSSVMNCFVQGAIKGGAITGGIVGRTYNTDLINSAALCDVTSKIVGGIVGMTDKNSVLRNCYMGGSISPTGTWHGTIVAIAYGGLIHNCYYKKPSLDFRAIDYNEYCDYSHIIQYQFNNGNWLLDEPAIFDNVSYYNLVDVLNKGVEFVNISGLKTWQNDDANINNGFPIFGEEYFVTCPNTSNLFLHNIVQDDNHGVVVSWDENGNAEQWQIRYRLQDSTEYSVYTTSQNPDTLWNLSYGENYRFSIRSICDEAHHSAWTDDVVIAVKTPYWTETVVSQPVGYTVDFDGNITISTSEGLAWLISVVNGLNGQEPNNLKNKQVLLASDVDMSNLRWVSINGFSGQFDGDNHIISGINIDEQSNNQGFFGSIENANIVNVNMQNVTISALNNVGGLCGYSQRSSFDNCRVSGIINGRNYVGGLIGEMDNSSIQHSSTQGSVIASVDAAGGLVGSVKTHLSYVDESLLPVNCYVGNSCSSCDVMATSNCTGGLIGSVYAYLGDVMIENSYSRNTISGYTYVGGLIGSATGFYSNIVTLRNCCSYNNVEAYPWIANSVYPDEWLNGAFIGQCVGSVRLSRCYMIPNGDLQFIGSHHGTFDGFSMSDTSFFDIIDSIAVLENPVSINSISYNHVDEALNAWVELFADGEYFTWVPDTSDEYNGKPVFGDLYNESCQVVVNIQTDSVWNNGVRLSWNDDESVSLWKVEYGECGFEKGYGMTLYVSDNFIDIQPLNTGSYYDFYVQAICDDNKLGKCDSKITVKPDKEYWKDIVTNRPNGYDEDVDGNIYISTAEGLAWLISVSNGLNGETGNSFYNKTIYLTQDVDISDYRWTTIQSLEGVFNGMNHTITGLYINEDDDYHAMFYSVSDGAGIINMNVKNSMIIGKNYVAGLCVMQQGVINNCAIDCTVHSNKYSGIVTALNYGSIKNSYVKGNIFGTDIVGGAVGWNYGNFYNCYSASILESCMLVHRDVSSSRLGQFTGQDFVYDNSNIAYWANTPFNIANSLHATNDSEIGYYSFSGSDTSWSLTTPQMINGQPYSRLVSALNAWVDANNTEGQYRHWAADTAMVNGGFPVFAAITCPEIDVHDTIAVCDSYIWHGMVFTADTLLTDSLSTFVGCDSVVTHHLIVNHPVHTIVTETTCESYEWNGETYTISGDYDQTFTAANGCDSVVTLQLTINQPITGTDVQTACGSYTWIDGITYTESNSTATYTLTNASGCDSVVTLHLTINPTYSVTDSKTVCQSLLPYTWNGVTFNAAGTQSATLPTVNGCDSIVTMTLTVNPTYNVIDSKTICQSQLPYTWNGVTFTAAGTQSATLPTVNGCDSVVTMTLTVNPTYNVTDSKTICQSQLPYIWNGVTFTAAGTQSATLPTVNGCDSVVTMTLTVNPTYSVTDTKTICQSQLPYEWNGVTFNTPGTQSATLQTVNGCDSVVVMTLIVNPTYNVTDSKIICQSQLPYTWNGVTFNAAGTQTATLPTVNGCDSVVVMTLIVNQPTTGTDVQVACGSYTWIDGVTYTESNNTATYMLTNAAGCDSVVTLNLTISQPTTGIDVQTVCGSYTWIDGITYTESNSTATYMLTNAVGCDSIVTLNLTINQPTTGTDMQTACDSFTWIDGVTYTESNSTATYTLTNAAGCDSVVTLNLTLNHAETAEIAETACGSFEWNGVTFTTSGDYTQTFTNATGCDSVVTLHLTVSPIEESDFSITTEDSCYTWNGQDYCTSGDYTQTLQTVHGCDSVVTMHLTITVGVNDYDAFDFKVYPNPTTGVVNVQITNHNSPITEFHVYDAYGKLIRLLNVQATQIDLSGLANGVYFVKAVAEGNVVAVRKVVKN